MMRSGVIPNTRPIAIPNTAAPATAARIVGM
ncbi:Uncharacterised protein [Vibrio cholerae]|nr:Uncharacterised protein [Vibrio cholerae]CSI21322.1 Uncharacterised protein [Vibrio cholerae]